MKILAVDDDSIILRLLTEVLQSAGYDEVYTCQSAERALELIGEARTPFECFLLDIQMPGMDGIELCQQIRKIARHKRTPILMLTAMSEKSYIDRAFEAGASDYLTKPLDPTEIIVRLGLADQLQQERRSLAESSDVIDSLIEVLDRSTRIELEDAIDLGKMDRLLRYPAFENYLYQSGRGVLFLSAVFAVKVRNVQELHRKLPPLEFKNLLRTAASAIIKPLSAHEVFVTYRGEGEFVGVVPRKGQHALRAIREDVAIGIEESEGKFADALPEDAKLVFGDPVPIRLPTRGELSKAIWSAVENVRMKTAPVAHRDLGPKPARAKHYPFSRMFWNNDDHEENLRAEFKEMLREQLTSEIGEHPKASKKKVSNRASAFKADDKSRKAGVKGSTKLFPKVGTTEKKPKDELHPDRSVAKTKDGGTTLGTPGDDPGNVSFSNA